MSDRLIPILERKRVHVAHMKQAVSLAVMRERIAAATPARGFLASLRQRRAAGSYGLIAEMKRASPSKGRIVEHFDAAAFARAYQAGGAACLSVLTDEPYFQGLDTDLIAGREAVTLPVLRKDFMVDPYQIEESRALGADCILLIAAALDDSQLGDFFALAESLGMDSLVEVHDRRELDRALAIAPPMIGINNRNLKSLKIDLATSLELIRAIPEDVLAVSESGISSPDDLRILKDAGISTFLIGESLLRQTDLTHAVKSLLIDSVSELK